MRPSLVTGLCLVAVLAAMTGGEVFAAMSSTNYEIRFDNVGSGGEDTSSSSSYQLRDTIGGTSSQGGSSTSYQANSGFRAGIFDPSVEYELFIQSSSTEVGASGLAGTTVTVSTTTGYSTEDMIAIVQDKGASQVTAIGKVAGLTATTLTVDFLTDAGVTPVIDGTNDYVYALNGSGVSLGVLSDTALSTAIVAWESNTDTDEGYSVYVIEDDDLKAGGDTIPDVTDGTVNVGSSEYGGRSSDTSLSLSTFDTEDSAITSALQQVGSRSSAEFQSRDFVTLKVAVSDTQQEGAYSHSLNFVYVGDY